MEELVFVILAQAATQPAQKSLLLLLWPLGILLALLVGSLWSSAHWWLGLKTWLSARRRNRSIVAIIPATAFAILVPICLDRAMVEDIKAGKLLDGYTSNLCVVAVSLAAFIWSQFVSYWFADASLEDARVDRRLLEEAKRFGTFNLGVARAFLTVVSFKAERITALVKELSAGKKLSLPRLKTALNPSAQKESLLAAVHTLFNNRVSAGHTMRVTFYEIDGEFLVPRLQHNGQIRRQMNNFFNACKDKLRINPAAPGSLQVAASVRHDIMIAPDAPKAHDDPKHAFCWMISPQEDKIGSMVAIPLNCGEGPNPAQRVLTLDTDLIGFFEDSQEFRTQLSLLADNVNERLLFEVDMSKVWAYA